MPIYTVKVKVSKIETYEIEAESAADARDDWADGEFMDSSADSVETVKAFKKE